MVDKRIPALDLTPDPEIPNLRPRVHEIRIEGTDLVLVIDPLVVPDRLEIRPHGTTKVVK